MEEMNINGGGGSDALPSPQTIMNRFLQELEPSSNITEGGEYNEMRNSHQENSNTSEVNTTVLTQILQQQALYSHVQVRKIIEELQESIDATWLITGVMMILTMKLGFALLEVGSVRNKNTSNILLKNVVDSVTGALIYYIIGFGLQFDQNGGIIGQGKFAANDFQTPKDYLQLLFSFSFVATSTTIVSGALAERVYLDTYLVYAVIMTGFLNPIAAGWAWGGGWLAKLGFHDFSGSGIVHLIGGTASIWATYICGPRLGRFGNIKIEKPTKKQSVNISLEDQGQQQQFNEVMPTRISHSGSHNDKRDGYVRNKMRGHSDNSAKGEYPNQIQVGDFETLSAIPTPNFNRNEQIQEQNQRHYPDYQDLPYDNATSKCQKMDQPLTFAQTTVDHSIILRLFLFREEHPEFKDLDNPSLIHLIRQYDQNFDQKIESNNMNSIVQGVFILFVTWLFFNGASGFTIVHRDNKNRPQKIVMNTVLAGSAGAFGVKLFKRSIFRILQYPHTYQIIDVCSGALAGLVSVTASCNDIAHWSALIIGFIGSFVYILSCIFMIKFKIDDPVEASQVHGFCGVWGVLAVGIFDRTNGLIYTGNFRQLGIQALGAFMLFLWSSLLSFGYFYLMKKMNRLRVDPIYEIIGLDAVMHEEVDKFNHVPLSSIKVANFKRNIKSKSERGGSSKQSRVSRQPEGHNFHDNASQFSFRKHGKSLKQQHDVKGNHHPSGKIQLDRFGITPAASVVGQQQFFTNTNFDMIKTLGTE